MRTLIALSLLASLPALADRYWDVPPAVAAEIAAEVEGQVVIEFCSGCGEIFTVFRVNRARVGAGDYSEDKQVHIERTVLMSGVSPEPLKLQGSCGKIAEHVDKTETRLDIPYTWIRRGDRWTWLGKETLSGREPYISLAPGAEAALEDCARTASGGLEVKRAGAGWRVGGAELRLRETSVKVDRRVKGARTWQRVTGVELEVREGGKTVKARAPTLTMSGAPRVVHALRTPGGVAYLVDMGVQDAPNAFVLFTPRDAGYLAHLLPGSLGLAPSGDRLLKGKGHDAEMRWDPASERVIATRGRFPIVDDLNLRASPPRGRPITQVHRGAYLATRGDRELKAKRYWRELAYDDGQEEQIGYTVDSLLTPFAPLYDPAAGRWIQLSDAEAARVGLKGPALRKLRALGERLESAGTVEKLCAALPGYEKTVDELSTAIGDAWHQAGETEPFLEIMGRLSHEVPGVDFYIFSEGVVGVRRYSALSPRLRGAGSEAAADVLRAAEALSGRAFPIYLTRTWDLGGCHEPSDALLSLKLLARSWGKTPACLRGALKEGLSSSLGGLGAHDCFCSAAEKVRPDVEAARRYLDQLGELGGPAHSEALGGAMKKGTFSSDCVGG